MGATPLSQLEKTTTIPGESLHIVEMGDGSGTKVVTQKTLVEETGNALKIGNLAELQTENKENLVAAINEAAQSGGGGASVDILDSKEEIEANTEAGKVAGAMAVKGMFTELNDKVNGNILTYNESEDAYYIQHGADAVPKKLDDSGKRIKSITFKQTFLTAHEATGTGSSTFTITYVITFQYNNGVLTDFNISSSGWGQGGRYAATNRGTSSNSFVQQ